MKPVLIFFCSVACVSVLIGCQDDTAGSPPPKPMTEAQLNNQLNAIQNNPKIPAQSKEIATRQMRAAYEMMKAQSENVSKGKQGHKTD